MSQDIFGKIKQAKEKFHEKVGENLRDRVRYEANNTLKIIDRLKNRGYTDREILRDIERSQEIKKNND